MTDRLYEDRFEQVLCVATSFLRRRVDVLTLDYSEESWRAEQAHADEPPTFESFLATWAIPVVAIAGAVLSHSVLFSVGAIVVGAAASALLWVSTRKARARRLAQSRAIKRIYLDLDRARRDLHRAIAVALSARYGVDLLGAPVPGHAYLATTPRGVERVQYVEVGDQPRLLRGDVELERLTSSSSHPEGPAHD